jgi:hypothetical protein
MASGCAHWGRRRAGEVVVAQRPHLRPRGPSARAQQHAAADQQPELLDVPLG